MSAIGKLASDLNTAAASLIGSGYLPRVLIGMNADGNCIARPVGEVDADTMRKLVARVMVGEIDPSILEK